MIRASDIIALVKTFTQLHSLAGTPMHPVHAGTISTLLDICERDVLTMERQAVSNPAPSVSAADENVIHLRFNRPTPPEGGAA